MLFSKLRFTRTFLNLSSLILRMASFSPHTELSPSLTPGDHNVLHEAAANHKRKRHKSKEDDPVEDTQQGLFNVSALTVVTVWYIVSFIVIILNKYIMSTMHGDPTVLCSIQMLMITILGYFNMHFPLGMYKKPKREGSYPHSFFKNMLVVGTTRFATVFLGIVALKFVAVSFTETVKSSAPIFTVILSRMLLGEYNGLYVQLSLLPIMVGLGLCSAYELSFNIQGFMAALSTNLCECLQFVYSKLLISGETFKYTPGEFQFYSSLASTVVMIPACLLLVDIPNVMKTMDSQVLLAMVINGAFLHTQTMMAFILMSFISPVTHSVTNTVKRALMIWGSVLVFGNPVTFLSGIGTAVVFLGVLLYNKARQYDQEASVVPDNADFSENDVKHV